MSDIPAPRSAAHLLGLAWRRPTLQARVTAAFFAMGIGTSALLGLAFGRFQPAGGLFMTTAGLCMAACAWVSWALARSVLAPVRTSATVARRIAVGDLDGDVPSEGPDEMGALLAAVRDMREQIRMMLSREMTQRLSAQGLLVDALEGTQEGVVVVGPDGCIAHVNSQAVRLVDQDGEALRPGEPVSAVPLLAAGERQPGSKHDVGEVQTADGRWLRVSRGPTRDGGAVVVCSDVTAIKAAAALAQIANARLATAVGSMAQGICLFDADDVLQLANRRFCQIYRLDPAAIVPGLPLGHLCRLVMDAGNFHGAGIAGVIGEMTGRPHEAGSGLHHQNLSDGRIVAVVRQSAADGGWVATFEDATERCRAQDRLRHAERHDSLTGLGNRILLFERLEAMLAGPGRFGACALLHVDLHKFRTVNDALGQVVGDQLLRSAAGRLSGLVRDSDVIARTGGDKFVIVRPGIRDPAEAEQLGRRVLGAFDDPFRLGDARLAVGACIGIAAFPGDAVDGRGLFAAADLALDRAKQAGRGGLSFADAGADAVLQQRRALELDLQTALAREEFDLHFQPLYDLAQARIIGFEALLRWRHPARGMVSPADFIPIAERAGLIVPIGEWVLRRACAAATAWPNEMKVAVNVSPPQLLHGGLVRAVADALTSSGLAAGRLEIEITESVLLAETDSVVNVLRDLRGVGVRVAMDDFGTGYSSLNSLRSFPFDKIKIDQVFVRNLRDNGQPIVRAVIGLGHSLGMRLTAEGVETAEQLSWLRREGCHEAQGYLISRPRPADEIPALLAATAARTFD